MPRNIVICCDAGADVLNASFGTSNVLKLYATLTKDDSQVCYYHPGSPSKKSHKAWGDTILGVIKSILKFDLFELSVSLFGFVRESEYVSNVERLAFGSTWLEQIASAYEFLVTEYQKGDRIFLFGFSFGAYAVRVLANLLQTYGILDPRVKNVIPDVTEAFKRLTRRMREGEQLSKSGLLLKRTFSRDGLVEFVGVWETVGSIGLVHNPIILPYANEVPVSRRARQALSIDERRWGFRARLLEERVTQKKGSPDAQQDVKEVWFAGVHSDVGGGYSEQETGIAPIALEWMLGEALQSGLSIDMIRAEIALGRAHAADWPWFALPDPRGTIHLSLKGVWWLQEFLPRRYWDSASERKRWCLPKGQHRYIPENSYIHKSVLERMTTNPHYHPLNLPRAYRVEESQIAAGTNSSSTS